MPLPACTSRHRLLSAATLALALSVAAGCAVTDQAAPQPVCPQARLRTTACADGQRLSTYDEQLALAGYCDAAGNWPRNVRVAGRKDPPVRLKDGARTYYMGSSGWLLFPPEKDPTDTPQTLARWWKQRDCALPPS